MPEAPIAPANASATSGGMIFGDEDPYEADFEMVEEDGTPVVSRLPSGRAMRTIVDELIADDAVAAQTRGRIEGMVNGNKPISDKKLRDDAQSYRANWNDRQSESVIDNRASAYFNMLFDTGRTIEVSFTPGFFPDQRIADEYASRIARAFTTTFTREPQIIEALQLAIRDSVELGVGFPVSTNKFDWRVKTIRRGRCFFNRDASANCRDMLMFFALGTMTVSEAWGHIEKEKASTLAGWHIDRLKIALADFFFKGAAKQNFKDNYVLMIEEMERMIRDNDSAYFSRQDESMPIVYGFIEERSGRVSQYISPYRANSDEWIFEDFEALDSMADAVIPIPFDFGDGTLAGVKGLGHRIFPHCTESNRLLMHTIDAVKLSTSLIVQNKLSGDNLAFSMHRFGPVTLLDKNTEPIQTSFAPRIEPAMQLREMLQRILNNNVDFFRSQQENTTQRDSEKTAEQVRMEASHEVKTKEDRAFFAYLRWDALVQTVFKKLISKNSRHVASPRAARQSAQGFWDMCENLGVPLELFTKYSDKIHVRATRSIGSGSPYTKQQNLLALKQLASQSMSEMGRRQLDRELGNVLVGSDNVDKFIPLSEDSQVPTNEHSIAGLEVNDFYEGTECIVGVDQIHSIHIAVHMAAMVQEAQTIQQDPMSVDIERSADLFQYGIPHTLRHIQYLAADPLRKIEAEQNQASIDALIPKAQQVIQMAEQIKKQKAEEILRLREENQRLQQEFSKENLAHKRALLQIQQKGEQDRLNTENLNQNRNAKTQTQLQLSVEKLGAKLSMDQANFQQQMIEKQSKLQADIAKAQTEIQLMIQKAQAKNVQ